MEPLELKIDNKIVHAGILPRLYARIIDSLAIGMFSLACYYSGKINLVLFWVSFLCYAFIIVVYMVYANFRCGASLGKYVASIRVTGLDGSRISLMQSFVRSSVDLLLVVITWGIFLYSVSVVGLEKYQEAVIWERASLQTTVYPWWRETIFRNVSWAWFVAGAIVFFLNKRRRAIHDFMGKMVVIFEEFSEVGRNQEAVKRIGNTEFSVNIKSVILQVVIGGTVLSMLFWAFF